MEQNIRSPKPGFTTYLIFGVFQKSYKNTIHFFHRLCPWRSFSAYKNTSLLFITFATQKPLLREAHSEFLCLCYETVCRLQNVDGGDSKSFYAGANKNIIAWSPCTAIFYLWYTDKTVQSFQCSVSLGASSRASELHYRWASENSQPVQEAN